MSVIDGNPADLDVATSQVETGVGDARELVDRDDDVIARAPIDPVHDGADAVGGGGHETDPLCGSADQGPELFSEVTCIVVLGAALIEMRESLAIVDVAVEHLGGATRQRSGCCVIEIGRLGGDRKLFEDVER
jgi:hypothetical protein